MKTSLKVLDSRNFLTLHKKKASLRFACGKFSSKSYIMFVLGTSFFPYVFYSKLIFYTFARCFLFRFSIFPSTALLVISIASMCTVFRTSSFLLPQLFRLALFFYYSNSLFLQACIAFFMSTNSFLGTIAFTTTVSLKELGFLFLRIPSTTSA